jgi:hypothetical protein
MRTSKGIVRRVLGLTGATVLAIAGVALAATPLSTGKYFGSNSENGQVTFKVVSHGTALTNFKSTLGYNGKCGQGGGPGYNVKIARIAIPTSGKFTKKTTLRLLTFHAPGEVTGKVSASGFEVKGKIIQFLHGKPNKCYTETFTAYPQQQQQQ